MELLLPMLISFFTWIQRTEGFFDSTLTIVSRWGQLTGHEPTAITCMSALQPVENLQFDRLLNTGQESGLPANRVITVDRQLGISKTLLIHASTDDKDRRFGAFSCSAKSGNITTRVVTLKQPPAGVAEVAPRHAYFRTSINNSVLLQMLRRKSHSGIRLVWRHQGEKLSLNVDRLRIVVPKARPQDAGIYELFYEQRRRLGAHGIMRLIVRECPFSKYGNMCELACPVCLNGGICHERYGMCLCPPGFTGTHCERACGSNRFGVDCTWQCDPTQYDLMDGCARHLICLPDPYGCSCAAGFMGLDCLNRCPAGRFGADCLQACRCHHRDTACNIFTGSCPDGCQEGWTGESCQQPSLGEVQELQYKRTNVPDQVILTWNEPRVTHGPAVYIINWWLAERNACGRDHQEQDSKQLITRDRMATLKDLLPFSTYEVTIFANASSIIGDVASITVVTDETVPVLGPTGVEVTSVTVEELGFSWHGIPCMELNGQFLAYEGELWNLQSTTDTNDVLLSASSRTATSVMPLRMETSGTEHRYKNLIPYTPYHFRVRALTGKGAGPWSDGITVITEHAVPPSPQVLLLDKTARTLTVGVNAVGLPMRVISGIRLRGWQEDWEDAAKNVSSDIAVSPTLEASFNVTSSYEIHNHTFTRLQPFTMYMIQSQIATSKGWSNWSSFNTAWTDETYPSAPTITLDTSSTNSLAIKLHKPNPSNGIIVNYQLRVAGQRMSGVIPQGPIVISPDNDTDVAYTINNLLPATRYHIQAQASTGIGWGNWSEQYEFWTEEGAPGPPASIRVLPSNYSSLYVEWMPPEVTNGKLVAYEVTCTPVHSLNARVELKDMVNFKRQVDSSTHSLIINELHPLTKYRVRIRAHNRHHKGQKLDSSFMTGMEIPSPPRTFPDRATDTAIPMEIHIVTTTSISDSVYQIVVEDSKSNDELLEWHLSNFSSAETEGLHYYIAAEFSAEDIPDSGLMIYIGDDRMYGLYKNVPLQNERSYYFLLRVVFFTPEKNYTALSERTANPLKVNAMQAAQVIRQGCRVYNPQCLWFPFMVIGCVIIIVWAISAIVICKCLCVEVPPPPPITTATSTELILAYPSPKDSVQTRYL